MPRERTGYVYRDKSDHKWRARITYVDRAGKRHNIVRIVKDRAAGRRALRQLEAEIERKLSLEPGARDASRMTVEELCDYYLEHYCKPPAYVGDRKVSGLRNWQRVSAYVKTIREHFGKRLLSSITYGDLLKYRQTRLDTPTQHKRQRSITATNREMEYLRRLLNIAAREGWIQRTPFAPGLVSKADERHRERILTREEESRLLGACDKPRRRHLRTLILIALDTGMRRGEILKLRWADIDFAGGKILVQAWNTKTMRARTVPVSKRVHGELTALKTRKKWAKLDDLIFGGLTQFDNAWRKATAAAGLQGVRFHDLRHTAATRLVQGGLPIVEVARILGHTTLQMSYRYTNSDDGTLARAALILDIGNESGSLQEVAAGVA